MSVLTSSGPSGVTDLAQRLAQDLNDGRVARQSFGARAAAFEWSSGLPSILALQVNNAVVDGLSFQAVRVAPSGTPAKKVAENAAKPDAVTITSDTVPLAKYAGLANFSTERAIDTDSLVSALAAVITRSCLLAFDADCMAALGDDAGLTATGTNWADAVLSAIGEVAAAGGAPTVLVISAGDYAAAVGSPGVGYALSPLDGIPSLFGLRIVLSSALASGTAYVLDAAAAMAVENAATPVAVLDPFSGLATNAVRLAVEMFAGFVVTAPGAVCEVTVTAASGLTGGGSQLTRGDVALGA